MRIECNVIRHYFIEFRIYLEQVNEQVEALFWHWFMLYDILCWVRCRVACTDGILIEAVEEKKTKDWSKLTVI